MGWTWRKGRRSRTGAGLEVTAALSAATQMALLYPPGCDDWTRRELAGENGADRSQPSARDATSPR